MSVDACDATVGARADNGDDAGDDTNDDDDAGVSNAGARASNGCGVSNDDEICGDLRDNDDEVGGDLLCDADDGTRADDGGDTNDDVVFFFK